MKTILYVWLSYGPLSIVISLIAFLTICNQDTLKSPFYRLVRCDLIINIICYLHTWFKRIATDGELSHILIPLVVNAPYLLPINGFVSHCFYHIQSGSLLVKCFFRYTVATQVKAPEKWQKHYRTVYVCVIIFSILYTLPYAFASQLKTITYNSTTATLTYNRNIWGGWGWVMDVQVGVYLCLTLAIGIATWYKIRKEWRESVRIRNRVTFVIIADATIHICVWLWHYLPRSTCMSTDDRTILLFCVSDLITCSTPYILLICDTKFRKEFFSCNIRSKIHPAIITGTNTPKF